MPAASESRDRSSDPETAALPCGKLVVVATGAVGVLALPLFLVTARQRFAREIRVVMTQSACRFLTPYAVHVLSGAEPVLDLFDPTPGALVPHIDVTAGANLLVALPATANLIAKVAHGIADDPASTTILAAACPVAFVPAMNETMWRKPAVQRNLDRLRADGYHLLDPADGIEVSGMKASFGAMPEVSRIVDFLGALIGGPSG